MAYLVFVAELFTTVSQGKDSDSGSELPDLGLKSGFEPPNRLDRPRAGRQQQRLCQCEARLSGLPARRRAPGSRTQDLGVVSTPGSR